MTEDLIHIKYSQDEEYRYKIAIREKGIFEVWAEQKAYDYLDESYSIMEFVGWTRVSGDDYMHLTDSYERAQEIGGEIIDNLTGS